MPRIRWPPGSSSNTPASSGSAIHRGHLANPAPLSGRVGRGEMNAGYGISPRCRMQKRNAASGNGFAILPTQFCSRDPSPTRLSPLLPNPAFRFCILHRSDLPHPAFLFCILHRGELPHPAFISPLCIPSPHPSALVCETCSRRSRLPPLITQLFLIVREVHRERKEERTLNLRIRHVPAARVV